MTRTLKIKGILIDSFDNLQIEIFKQLNLTPSELPDKEFIDKVNLHRQKNHLTEIKLIWDNFDISLKKIAFNSQSNHEHFNLSNGGNMDFEAINSSQLIPAEEMKRNMQKEEFIKMKIEVLLEKKLNFRVVYRT